MNASIASSQASNRGALSWDRACRGNCCRMLRHAGGQQHRSCTTLVTLSCRRLLNLSGEHDRDWTCGDLRDGVHEGSSVHQVKRCTAETRPSHCAAPRTSFAGKLDDDVDGPRSKLRGVSTAARVVFGKTCSAVTLAVTRWSTAAGSRYSDRFAIAMSFPHGNPSPDVE